MKHPVLLVLIGFSVLAGLSACCTRMTPPGNTNEPTSCDPADRSSSTTINNGDGAATDPPKRLKMKMLGQRQRIDRIKSDPLEMGEVRLEGDTLTIQVTYGGGRKQHDFALYWDGSVAESFPAQMWVQLKHDANGDTAEALITQTLRFDVSDLPNDGRYFVHVVAGDSGRETVKRGGGW